MRSTADLSTSARIRDAAIACFADHGVSGTSARKIAAIAGVSPALIIHHFGSMDGLREACDEHVVAAVRDAKAGAMSAGPGVDVGAALRGSDVGNAAAYIARMLVEDSPLVDRLVDGLIADAEVYFASGVASGLLRPTDDPHGRVAVIALWSLGALVLHRHMRRILGVDLTDPDVGADPGIAAYLGPAYEIFGSGIFTAEAAEGLLSAMHEIGASRIGKKEQS